MWWTVVIIAFVIAFYVVVIKYFGSRERASLPTKSEGRTAEERRWAEKKRKDDEIQQKAKAKFRSEFQHLILPAEKIKLFQDTASLLEPLKAGHGIQDGYNILLEVRSLLRSIKSFGAENPDDGSILFLYCFLRSIRREYDRDEVEFQALTINKDIKSLIKPDAHYVLIALYAIRNHPDCAKIAYDLMKDGCLSDPDSFPARTLIARSNDRAQELMRIYETFWREFAPPAYQCPLDVHGAISVRSFFRDKPEEASRMLSIDNNLGRKLFGEH